MAEQTISLSRPVDRQRFAELEQVIERGLGTFVDVGRALLEIQEHRLYRTAGHRTFADYVAKRWDLSAAHAYRQIEASKVVDILSPIGDTPLPSNEAQARELTPLVDDPEAVRAVWSETLHDGHGRVTARAVKAHVAARRPAPGAGRASEGTGTAASAAITCPACGHEWPAHQHSLEEVSSGASAESATISRLTNLRE